MLQCEGALHPAKHATHTVHHAAQWRSVTGARAAGACMRVREGHAAHDEHAPPFGNTHAHDGQTTADRATDDSGRWPADTERPVLGEKHWVLHAPREPHPLEPSGDLDPALFANEPPLLEVRAPRRATDNAHLSSHRTTPSSSQGHRLRSRSPPCCRAIRAIRPCGILRHTGRRIPCDMPRSDGPIPKQCLTNRLP